MTSNDNCAAQTLWVDVNGLRVHCLAAGDGPSVLMLHGGGLDSARFTYRCTVGPLSEERRVFAPDLPGYGGSDKPDVERTVPFYVGFLGRLVDALRLEETSLVGLSVGGSTGVRAPRPSGSRSWSWWTATASVVRCPGGV